MVHFNTIQKKEPMDMKHTEKVFGYYRISTKKQSIARQVRNIEKAFPTVTIICESFTGTRIDRPEWNKLYKRLKNNPQAPVVFDEISRMGRNAEEDFQLYMELFVMRVNLIFLKKLIIPGLFEPPVRTSPQRTGRSAAL